MRTDRVILSFLAIAFVMSFFFMFPQRKPIEQLQQIPPMDQTQAPPADPTLKPTAAPADFASMLSGMTLPAYDTIRSELQINPHTTPPSISKADEQIKNIYKITQSQTEAEALMTMLEKCITAPTTQIPQLHIVCLNYARQIGKNFPALDEKYKKIKQQTSPKVQEMHASMKSVEEQKNK